MDKRKLPSALVVHRTQINQREEVPGTGLSARRRAAGVTSQGLAPLSEAAWVVLRTMLQALLLRLRWHQVPALAVTSCQLVMFTPLI